MTLRRGGAGFNQNSYKLISTKISALGRVYPCIPCS